MHTPMLAMSRDAYDCYFWRKLSHFGSKPHMVHVERESTGLHKSIAVTGPDELTEALGSLPKWEL